MFVIYVFFFNHLSISFDYLASTEWPDMNRGTSKSVFPNDGFDFTVCERLNETATLGFP